MIIIEVLPEQKKQVSKYPYVGKHKISTTIVFFISPKRGFCLPPSGNHISSNEESWFENEFYPVDITIRSTI